MGQRQSSVQQQQQQHPAQRAQRCNASAAEAPSAAPGSTVQVGKDGKDSKRKLTYVSYEANSWQATFEQTGALPGSQQRPPRVQNSLTLLSLASQL